MTQLIFKGKVVFSGTAREVYHKAHYFKGETSIRTVKEIKL